MINILNNNEIGYVSGGWVCDSTHNGVTFLKAVWHSETSNKGFGACHYGSKEGVLYYSVPSNLTGVVREPINFWVFAGDKPGGYTKYECLAKDANKCVFK